MKMITKFFRKYINLIKRKKKLKFFLIFLVIFTIARIAAAIYTFNFKYSDKETVKEVMIISLKKVEDTKISYNVRYNGNNFILNIYSRNDEVLDKEKYANFKYADKVKVSGKIQISKLLNNPNEFDYKKYLNSNNIVANINTYSATKLGKKNGIFLLSAIYDLKEKVGKKVDENLNKENAPLFKSMIYGDKLDMSEYIMEVLRKNGLSHVISVSGTNLSYLIMVFAFLFSDKKTKKDYSYLYIAIITIFVIFSNFSISIIRAGIMNIVSIISRKKNIHLKKFTSTAISFLVIFLHNPYSIFNTSTIFSYLAVISIILFENVIRSFLCLKLKKILNYKYIEKSNFKKNVFFLLMFVIQGVALHFSVQVLILPVQIYTYGSISLTSVISNVVLTPVILSLFLVRIFISCFLLYSICIKYIILIRKFSFNCICYSFETITKYIFKYIFT